MHSLNHKLSQLKDLPELRLDRKSMVVGKHQLLARLNRRQESRSADSISSAEWQRLVWLRISRKLIPSYQLVVSLVLIVALMTSTGIMAQAAVPGDFLWSVKLSFEKAELALTVDSVQEGRLHLKHVGNRLKELTVIVAQPEHTSKERNISQLVRRLEKDITAADQSLKITKEERKDTEPQVIVALAKDLSARATQAVKALEENKRILEVAAQSIIPESVSVLLSTTTDQLLAEGGSEPGTTTAVEVETVQTVQRDLKDVITEVQIINEYISYNALAAMIEMVERRGATNRGETTQFLRSRIGEQQERLLAVQDAQALVNEDFQLHRNRVQDLSDDAQELLKKAEDAVNLDNLSMGLRHLNGAKELISQAAVLLVEVERGDGFNPREDASAPSIPATGRIDIQTMAPTSTEPDEGPAQEPGDH